MSKKPVLLMIMDGCGLAPASAYNAVTTAKTPNLDKYYANYPHTVLEASALAVGLPAGQIGNSEVGHMNIGAGRVIYQSLTRIDKAIKDGDFYKNNVLCDIMDKTKAAGTKLHLMGLLSNGGVHSHIEHVKALLAMAKARGVAKTYVHAFLDGRDVNPKSALIYLKELQATMDALNYGEIVTIVGRYWAMDRDQRWERIEKAYNALVLGKGETYTDMEAAINASYAAGITDEFLEPHVKAGAPGRITAGDGIIFFNFRPDRARQMTRALHDAEFTHFSRPESARPVNYACMAQYDATIAAPVAFPPQHFEDTLGEVLAKHHMRQLRIAETEKYAHVTFFFNGGVEEPNPGEDRILIPSPKVATYDLQPEMSAYQVTDALLEALDQDKYDAVILNFANPDMVGHTGVMAAAVKAMETVDTCAGRIVDKVLSLGGSVCITADHGNLEQMLDEEGNPHTAHTTNLVPFIVVSETKHQLHRGVLADIAPTMLELLHVEQPAAMTGKSLIDK